MIELQHVIEALSRPDAYPYPVDAIDVRQTHISAVFLAGSYVYKVKKPVNLGFVDFSTLEKRRHFCDEELRLNRRLAPDVYLGVVPVAQSSAGLRLEADGDIVDWAVKMRRLPDDATLHERLRRAEVSFELVEDLAKRIATFHRTAQTSDRLASFAQFDGVSRIILDIFDQAKTHVGSTLHPMVLQRLKALTEESLQSLRPIIDARAARGVPRDCHGDLHLDHIYYFTDRKPPNHLVIVDCIEFNERFRFIDPVADMAFPAMDFAFHGRRDLARSFSDVYFSAANDNEGRVLLPLYTTYRATVRGLVEGLELSETEIPQAEGSAAQQRARAHWLLALSELSKPSEKPCLVLVAGLPGTGKSRVAQDLRRIAGFDVIRSDIVRKELAGIDPNAPTPPHLQHALYSGAADARTYTECLHRAQKQLFEGRRVLVDATFREDAKRRTFSQAAVNWGVPSLMLVCQADPQTVRSRLEHRHHDASDADWTIYEQIAASWEPITARPGQVVHAVSTDGTPEEAVFRALEFLRGECLWE